MVGKPRPGVTKSLSQPVVWTDEARDAVAEAHVQMGILWNLEMDKRTATDDLAVAVLRMRTANLQYKTIAEILGISTSRVTDLIVKGEVVLALRSVKVPHTKETDE